MRVEFIKADCGYIALLAFESSRAVCALRLPWRISLDACTMQNELHGENMHLLTGVWTTRHGQLSGRTLIDRDLEVRVHVSTTMCGSSIDTCRLELSLINRGPMTRVAPVLLAGLELPPPPRRLQLGPAELLMTDSEGRSWSLHWPHSPRHARVADRRLAITSRMDDAACGDITHLSSDIDVNTRLRSQEPSQRLMQPALERVDRNLVAVSLPLGTAIDPGVIACTTGELSVIRGDARHTDD